MTNAVQKQDQKTPSIPFIDLQAQRKRLGQAMDNAILKTVHSGKYILGPEVKELENVLQEFSGAKHCISTSNGTDALALVLIAKKVRPGQAIFVPSFTFVATAEVVAWLGATAFFVDVEEDSFNMCPRSLAQAVKDAKAQNLTPAGVIAVDLFGQPADYPAIIETSKAEDMWVMADSAQSFGGSLQGKKVGTWGDATSASFFPAKPLGCYGDGGAVFTDDDALAEEMTSLRFHGKGDDKYDNVRIGMNARLDTVQAAILLQKMTIFEDELQTRQKVADYYSDALKEHCAVPVLKNGATSAWAQYTLRLPEQINRDQFMATCKDAGVPTMVYYPIPLSEQKAYTRYPKVSGGTPVSERLSRTVISLPMHPYFETGTQDYIIETVLKALAKQA